MQQERLSVLLRQQSVQKAILGNYRGSFSLGIILHPERRGEIAIGLHVEGNDLSHFPDQITFDGEDIAIIKQGNFQAPVPL